HLPADSFFQSISLCAFLVAVIFLFVYWRYQFESLGVFLFPLVFLMTLVGAMEAPVAAWTSLGVRDAWLKIHVLLVLSGYASLLLAAVASVCYLMQERRLKRKRGGGIFDRLPPLGTLDNLITQAMNIGFVLITLAVVAGSTWAFIESGTKWISEAKIAISLATWAIYLVMIFLRTSAGWRGRKAAMMSLTVLGCFVVTWAAHIGLRPILAQ
ncbi:MAG: cytochrome C assembly family protein, partial [Bryobacteraceae bacterium]